MQRAIPTADYSTHRIEFQHNGKIYQATAYKSNYGWGLFFKVDVDGYRSRWMWMDSSGYYQFKFKGDWIPYYDMRFID